MTLAATRSDPAPRAMVFLGLAVLVFLAALIQFTLIRAIAIVVKHRFQDEDREFWDKERRRLNRSVLVDATAMLLSQFFTARRIEAVSFISTR